jgi:hypothetical protein
VSAGTGDDGLALDRQSGGFDKGRRLVRLPAVGGWLWPARMSPMGAVARVPLSNPPRPSGDIHAVQRPGVPSPFAPADRRRAGRSGSVSGSGGLAATPNDAALAARAALWGRLENVLKVLTKRSVRTGRGGVNWRSIGRSGDRAIMSTLDAQISGGRRGSLRAPWWALAAGAQGAAIGKGAAIVDEQQRRAIAMSRCMLVLPVCVASAG